MKSTSKGLCHKVDDYSILIDGVVYSGYSTNTAIHLFCDEKEFFKKGESTDPELKEESL